MRRKILIIDDEEDLCQFVKLNLEITGKFEVLTANEGLAGINLAKDRHPDLILLDLLMPDMSGSEVADKLIDDVVTRDTPIIFLTALAQKKEVDEKGGAIGGRAFIAKPVVSEELIAKIESVLKEKR